MRHAWSVGGSEWIDHAIGGILASIGVFELLGGASFHFAHGGLAVALCLVTTLPLAVRRRAPLGAAAVIIAGLVLQANLQQAAPAASYFALLLNAYSVGSQRQEVVAGAVAIGTALAVAPHLFDGGPHPEAGDYLFTFVPILLATGIGVLQRRGLLRIGALQAEVSTGQQLIETRAQEAAAQERARIARELHDVVAHRMTVITVQAAAARRVASRQPAAALEALEVIEAQGREGLAEMRRLLDVMRLHGAEGPELSPQPGLAELDKLAGTVREAGIPLVLEVRGRSRPLPSSLDLSAYRILQEALTNVIKHAAGAETRVVVSYGEDELELEVVSAAVAGLSARGPAQVPGGGHGLVGMRERAAIFGGRLEAGPGSGGYRVHALLPIDAAPVRA